MTTRIPARRRSLRTACISSLAVAAALAFAGVSADAGTAMARSTISPGTGAGATPAVPQVVPKPVSMTTERGAFTIRRGTRIVAASRQAALIADDLAGRARSRR